LEKFVNLLLSSHHFLIQQKGFNRFGQPKGFEELDHHSVLYLWHHRSIEYYIPVCSRSSMHWKALATSISLDDSIWLGVLNPTWKEKKRKME
jgi:hypothetical protein